MADKNGNKAPQGGCPDKECHHKLGELRRFVYGGGPGDDIFSRACCEVKKVAKAMKDWQDHWTTRFWRLVASTIVVVIVGGYGLYHKAESASEWITDHEKCVDEMKGDIRENRDLATENNASFRVIQNDVQNINSQMAEMKTVLKEISKKLDK